MLPTQNQIETIYKKIWGTTAPPKKTFKTSEGVWGWEVVVLGYGPYQPANIPWRPLGIPNNPPLRWWRRCWSLQHQNVVDFRWIHWPFAKWWNNWRLSLAFLNFLLSHHLLLHLKFLDHLYFLASSYAIMDLDLWLVSKLWAFQIPPNPKLLASPKILQKRGEKKTWREWIASLYLHKPQGRFAWGKTFK